MSRKQKMAEFDQGYKVTVTGRHLHVTDAMKNYAIEKVSKIERIGQRIIEINIIMDVQKLDNRVDIIMKYGHTTIKSHAISTDMYVSIDQAVDKLESQLVKYKDRLHDHYLKGYPVEEVTVAVYGIDGEVDIIDENEVNGQIEIENGRKIQEEFGPHKIITEETKPLKILNDHEAIMKMDLSRDQFMVYRDEKTRKLRVIYRRNDGNYGVIQPE